MIDSTKDSQKLTEHFFRNEYGKMVSIITRYIGTENVETAEDIVQETLLKAVDNWQSNGIPKNPQAWLFTTAKNLTLNIFKRKKHQAEFVSQAKLFEKSSEELEQSIFTDEQIADEQLKMMFVCCHPSISEKSQIALILKILCGFNISEIASAFFTSNETINKRLVRGRKKLRDNNVSFDLPQNLNENLSIVLKAILLLFNEGYSPIQKNELIRYDLCLEAIRLCELLVKSNAIDDKQDSFSLLALMYLNASRFKARMNEENEIINMEKQDRTKWNRELIDAGIRYLSKANDKKRYSTYLILATISANHCIAPSFEETNWEEILSLYDSLIKLDNSPIVQLNRIIALSKVEGNTQAILELENLDKTTKIGSNYLFHTALAEFYRLESRNESARKSYKKAISLTEKKLTSKWLQKKLIEVVPI